MIVYLNGTFVNEETASISIFDSGFMYGEGVFTTLRIYNGTAPDLDGHWNRLRQQAKSLKIPFSITQEETEDIVEGLVRKNRINKSDARLRITITRRGDSHNTLPLDTLEESVPNVLIRISPLPVSIDQASTEGISVVKLGQTFLRNHLPHLKTLNYLPSLMALREAGKQNCAEAIMIDDQGLLTEGAVSNVFLVKDGALFTPPDNGRILAGLTRHRVIALAAQHNLNCREKNLTTEGLESADEVFMCNSIRQILPVISIDEHPVGNHLPGPITRKIQQWFDEAMRG